MEIEEYLGAQRYYTGGITGVITPSLITAVERFKETLGYDAESGLVSKRVYEAMRTRYWQVMGQWHIPPAFYFYTDLQHVGAHGAWQNVTSGQVSTRLTSRIVCSLEQKMCMENILLFDQATQMPDLAPVNRFNVIEYAYQSLLCRYQIHQVNGDKIYAVALHDEQNFEVPDDLWPRGMVTRENINIELTIDTRLREVSKKEVIRYKDNMGASHDSVIESNLVDSPEPFFSARYQAVQKQYFGVSHDKNNRNELLKWMNAHDFREYKTYRAGLKSITSKRSDQEIKDQLRLTKPR